VGNISHSLLAFEQLSGLKINFHKNELHCFGEAQHEVNAYQFIWVWAGTVSHAVFGDPDSLSETHSC
jgi:hypothetical protein